ncbi:MAG: signal peptide peptidase SppA [Candidatus Brocadiia bacterium]
MTRQTAAGIFVSVAIMLALCAARPCRADEPAAQPKPKIAVIAIGNAVTERPAAFSLGQLFGGGPRTTALSQLMVTLNKAASDANISGVLLDLKALNLSLAQAQELGGIVQKLRGGGKKVFVFAPIFTPATYILATNADAILMPEQGSVLIPGVDLGLMFFKGLLDKIGVQADVLQVGKYKGAEEPFTRTEASPEFKEQMTRIVDGLYGQMVQALAANRKLGQDKAAAAIDQAWFTGRQAKEAGLADGLLIRDELKDWLDKRFSTETEMLADYGKEARKGLDLSNPFAFFSILLAERAAAANKKPAIAVIYADAVIMDDLVEDNGLGGGAVTPARMRQALRKALDDAQVKAIVLRVDSPGGSAAASDEIWKMFREADRTKPVTVSMGRIAASGGYYIACSGRDISADEATLTGSIGVVGGKLVFQQLMVKIGVNMQEIARGRNAGLFSPAQPFDPDGRALVHKQMEEIYARFTDCVKSARGGKIANIDDVAQGRLFTGADALKAGLVDRIASLDQTILAAATAAGIGKDYQVLTLPEPKNFADLIREGLGQTLAPPAMQEALAAMPAPMRQAAVDVLLMCQSLQPEHVLLALPGIVEK